MESWATGAISREQEFENALSNAAAIRECQVLNELAETPIQDL